MPQALLTLELAAMEWEIGSQQSTLLTNRCSAVRSATVKRETKETKVEVSINLDGTGVCSSNTQIPFLDHMLDVRLPPEPCTYGIDHSLARTCHLY